MIWKRHQTKSPILDSINVVETTKRDVHQRFSIFWKHWKVEKQRDLSLCRTCCSDSRVIIRYHRWLCYLKYIVSCVCRNFNLPCKIFTKFWCREVSSKFITVKQREAFFCYDDAISFLRLLPHLGNEKFCDTSIVKSNFAFTAFLLLNRFKSILYSCFSKQYK